MPAPKVHARKPRAGPADPGEQAVMSVLFDRRSAQSEKNEVMAKITCRFNKGRSVDHPGQVGLEGHHYARGRGEGAGPHGR